MPERDLFRSRLGFILLSAGCAVGLGNIWKFPYMVGKYGGALFVLLYAVCLLILGIPILAMEFSVGRAAQSSPLTMYEKLEPDGTKWHHTGKLSLGGQYLIMMFYLVVTAWIVIYFLKSMFGELDATDPAVIADTFSSVTSNAVLCISFVVGTVIVTTLLCARKLVHLEKVTNVMMISLLVLIIVLVVYCLTLSGAADGVRFYLVPDLRVMTPKEWGEVIYGAMSHAFFTLSIGVGMMAAMGSFLEKKRSLFGEALIVTSLDTFIAIMAGFVIFPACFTFGVDADAGPGLIFETMPLVFASLPGGRLWGSLFFLFMCFAALSTALAITQAIITSLYEVTGWSKVRCCIFHVAVMSVLTLPCIFGFGAWSGFQPFGAGSSVLDLEDFIFSNIVLPLGSLIMIIFCISKKGWGWKSFIQEINAGNGIRFPEKMKFYCTYVLPLLLAGLMIYGLVTKFI